MPAVTFATFGNNRERFLLWVSTYQGKDVSEALRHRLCEADQKEEKVDPLAELEELLDTQTQASSPPTGIYARFVW